MSDVGDSQDMYDASDGTRDEPDAVHYATIDALVDGHRQSNPMLPGNEAEVRVVRGLVALHALPPAATEVLDRVRGQILAASLASMPEPLSVEEDTAPNSASPPVAHRTSARRSRTHGSLAWRAVAAVLIVALLGGGFWAVLRDHSLAPSAGGPAWRDVGITGARAASHLPFDPALGVVYAIGETDGAIYACANNQVWSSRDGGASYQPFVPALPVPRKGSTNVAGTCALATVPGTPGVFAQIPGPSASAAPVIGYASPGAASWRVLAPPVGLAAYLWQQMTSADWSRHMVRAAGPWLFALLDNQLYATDDFGATWLAPSAALLSQGITQTCTSFAVNPTDPANLYCTEGYGDRTASAGTATAADGVWETRDGGQTWRPLTAPGDSRSGAKGIPWNPRCQCLDVGMLIGASAGAIYAYTGAGIARHPLRGGSWQAVAALPQLTWSPGPRATAVTFGAPVDFAPDDTVYVAATQAMAPRAEVQAYTLPPGSMSFVAVGQRNPLPVTGVWSLALGGVRPGGQPAMYLYTPTLPNNGRLYRLALPGETSAPTLDGTPLPTTLPTAAASTVSCPAARGDLGAIRPGGLGADLSTFPGRWGPSDGVAGGSVYFGRYAGTNMPILEASAAPNHRVYLMSVRAYPSRRMTLAQAEALAQSILPANAVAQGGLQASGGATTRAYCSAAYAAAFPLSLGVPVAITAHWSSRTPWTAMVPSPRSPSARPLPRSGRHRS